MSSNTPVPADEMVIWEGGPSQIKNLAVFVACGAIGLLITIIFIKVWAGLAVLLIAPISVAIWNWLVVKCYRYKLTNQRLMVSWGVLSKTRQELELFRVKDTTVVQPFLLRIFSLGSVIMVTSDKTTPEVCVEAIHDVREVREKIRSNVLIRRDSKRVQEIDIE